MVKASVSQSVERAINVLEVFKEQQRPLTRVQIGEALNAPRSSLAALIQALTELDILSYDQRASTYLPGLRLMRLTQWMEPAFGIDDALREACRQLRDKTSETITLTSPVGESMEVLLVEQGLNPISYVVQPATTFPIWESAVGAAYLSTLDDGAIAKLHKSRRRPQTSVPGLEHMMEMLNEARRRGYALMAGAVAPGVAALTVPLPVHAGMRRLVLAVAGPEERIRVNEAAYARALRLAIASLASQS